MADHWQLSDYLSTEASLPYNRLPRTYLNWSQPLSRWISVGGHAEAVRFQHDEKAGGSRIDLKPTISFPIQGASWYVTPTLAYRYTGYQLDRGLVDGVNGIRGQILRSQGIDPNTATPEQLRGNTSPSRSLPIASLDAGAYFERDFEWGGEGRVQTLEPRLFYLKVPYRDQDDLPLFDTQPLTFSWPGLFRDNRFGGADRQGDADQVTLALTSRILDTRDGRERLSASLGRIHYFDPPRVTVPGAPPLSDEIMGPVKAQAGLAHVRNASRMDHGCKASTRERPSLNDWI